MHHCIKLGQGSQVWWVLVVYDVFCIYCYLYYLLKILVDVLCNICNFECSSLVQCVYKFCKVFFIIITTQCSLPVLLDGTVEHGSHVAMLEQSVGSEGQTSHVSHVVVGGHSYNNHNYISINYLILNRIRFEFQATII